MKMDEKREFSKQFLKDLYQFCADQGVCIDTHQSGGTVLIKDGEEIALISFHKEEFESICILPM